jgi:hypothetical protein
MADAPNKRMLYICVTGAALLPLVISMSQEGGMLSLEALFFVTLYIRSDRQREEAKPGFPVILNEPIRCANPFSEPPKLDYATPKVQEPRDLLCDIAVWALRGIGIALAMMLILNAL